MISFIGPAAGSVEKRARLQCHADDETADAVIGDIREKIPGVDRLHDRILHSQFRDRLIFWSHTD